MRKKKQREEELARAAALPSDPTPKNGGSVVVVVPDPSIDAACNPRATGDTVNTDVPAPKALTESTMAMSDGIKEESTVLRGSTNHVDSESNLYSRQINGVHFDTSLASTLAELAHSMSPSKGRQLQDDVGVIKASAPVTHDVICNGDGGGHLNSVSPR